jgi:hypothetical protein
MRTTFLTIPAALVAFAAPLLMSTTASAACDLAKLNAACGVTINTSAKCELQVSGGCTAKCTPLSCDASCNANFDVGCKVDCEAGCKGSCQVNPGSFDCKAQCEAKFSAECAAKCSSNTDKTACEGNCKAAVSADCGAQCTVVPPSASCDVKCKAECEGGCHAKANLDCQIGCQGGCDVQCQDPKGALFCDGEFIKAGSVDDCKAALESCAIVVTVYGDANASCSGNSCQGEAKGGFSCATAPEAPNDPVPWAVVGAAVVGFGVSAARRRMKK